MASIKSKNPADAEATDPLPPAKLDDIFDGLCTYLKYRSNPDKRDKKEDVIKSGVTGGEEKQDAEHHAEIKMLNQVYENHRALGGRSRQLLKLHEEEPLENELAQLKIDLQDNKREAREEIKRTENRKECEKKWTKITNKTVTQIVEKENALKHLKKYIDKGNAKYLRKYIHSNDSSPLSELNQFLPRVFFVSKSPCESCAQELIRAYQDRNKPTIYIAGVYEGKEEILTKLHRAGFHFEEWDLYREYEDWKEQYKCLKRFTGYQKIRDKTREALDRLKT